MNIVIVIEMTELEANRIGERFGCKAAPLRWQTQKTSFSNKQSKTPGTTAVIMVLTTVVSDSVHRRQSICHRPGVLDRVMEELFFCIYLLRVAGLLKKRLRMQFASSTGIFKYNNDIHTTANDVTKGLIGPC